MIKCPFHILEVDLRNTTNRMINNLHQLSFSKIYRYSILHIILPTYLGFENLFQVDFFLEIAYYSCSIVLTQISHVNDAHVCRA